ncbi:cyclin-D1-binding protein 1 homolog [Uloborus diversus]|uniref:cyclin-D1-binding protein 1 homolog n=1 Tax=Uloborus diversus TaxID=327109 RepID=UPI002408F654|nr:cyclin-D1-binding protein 1 homolog [Uloborus diversus]
MASSSDRVITTEIKNVLSGLEDSLLLACERVSMNPVSNENPDYNRDTFWTNFKGAVKLVSHEATKFCLMFEKDPLPSLQESKNIVDTVERTCLALVNVLNSLPKSKGQILHKELSRYVLVLLQNMKELCVAAKNGSIFTLRNVGSVWEDCESVENLPQDNKVAVCTLCRQELALVEDACNELMEAMESEDEPVIDLSFITPRNGLRIPPVRSWTDADRNVILPCYGMVKAARACLKQTLKAITQRGNADDDECSRELDAVAYIVNPSSTLIDDFILAIYPPVNHSALRHQAALVRNNFKELLNRVGICHFCSEDDRSWVELLEKAVDHNWVRINDLILAD